MPPENTGRIQAGQFRKGKSGNPSGKPKGARHQTTVAIEKLLEGEAEEIGRKAIELAKSGDTEALRLCLERIAPLEDALKSAGFPYEPARRKRIKRRKVSRTGFIRFLRFIRTVLGSPNA